MDSLGDFLANVGVSTEDLLRVCCVTLSALVKLLFLGCGVDLLVLALSVILFCDCGVGRVCIGVLILFFWDGVSFAFLVAGVRDSCDGVAVFAFTDSDLFCARNNGDARGLAFAAARLLLLNACFFLSDRL